MGKRQIMILALTLVAALGAAYVALNWIKPEPQQSEVVEINKVKMDDVLVASRDLKLGEKLSADAISWRTWPVDNIQDNMITKTKQADALEKMADARARTTIYGGEPVIEKKIVRPGDKGFMAAILPKGMRAISVAISERSAAGGFILPNDRVDVILTRKGGDSGAVKSETVLTNVRILAINQNLGKQEDGAPDTVALPEGKTATLELNPRQSEVIAQVESTGELSLSLRSIAENDGVPMEQNLPVLAEKYKANAGPTGGSDTLFVRAGRESYVSNR